MSWEAQAWVWTLKDLTPLTKMIALCFANFADPITNELRCGDGYVEEMTGANESSIKRAKAMLIEAGLMTLVTPSTGRGNANVYRMAVDLDRVAALRKRGAFLEAGSGWDRKGVQDEPERGALDGLKGCIDPDKGVLCEPPSLDTKKEPKKEDPPSSPPGGDDLFSGVVIPPNGKHPPLALKPQKEPSGRGVACWTAYSRSFQTHYGVEPVSNASSRGQMALFVDRVGAVEAPDIAAFFVTLRKRQYIERHHPVSLLLQDYQSIRTQWATGRTMTSTRANQMDRSQANFSAADEAIEIFNRNRQ
jgi:hypothetical protein